MLIVHSTGEIERELAGGRMLGYEATSTKAAVSPDSAFLTEEGKLTVCADQDGYKTVRERF
jgi:hypothetical protein